MYLYYEHHKDATGKIVLTEMRLSSSATGKLYIDHKSTREQTLKSLCIPILKSPPVSNRSMDEKIWVWTYFGHVRQVAGPRLGQDLAWGQIVIEKLTAVTTAVGTPIGLIEVHDLAAQAVNNYVNLSAAPKMRPEEFFYNHGVTASQPALTKDQVIVKLKVLLATDVVDKKSYRTAALKFHPDRNGGDGSKMSELNMLWQLYNAQTA
jgi:hypothetical protein